MTTEELFAQMEAQAANEKEYCVIDPITREISVPEVYQKIGVVSDEKTNRIYFQCPRIVGDNVDLTKYGIRVNYQNANGQTKPYPVDDVAVSGDNITFSWLLERPVTTYKGTVNFVVCAIKTSGDEITNEWNTTLAQAEVLEGLEPDISITEDEESIVELLVAQCTQKLTEMNMAIQNSENATNDAKTATQEAVNATEDARSVIEQITKDSYLHTALESFINEVTAKPTAYGNALVEKIEGYIQQDTTKGLNILSDKISAQVRALCTVLDNGKTYKVETSRSDSANSYVRIDVPFTLEELKGRTIYASKYTISEKTSGLLERVSVFSIASNGKPYSEIGALTSGGSVKIPNSFDEQVSEIEILIYADRVAGTISGSITYENLWLSLDEPLEEWESYTGGEPSPSPDYPQTIRGVGNMGFFDGEYQYVHHDNDNTLTNNPEWVSSVNIVPCKTGDNVEIVYAKANSKSMYGIIYYKGDKFVSSLAAQTGNGKFTVPSGVDGFQWQVYDGGEQPDPSKVAVTINGMYAICVKTVGKNLIDFDNEYASYGFNGEYLGAMSNFVSAKIKVPKRAIGKEVTFSAYLKTSSGLTNVRVSANVLGVTKNGNYINNENDYELSKVTFVPNEGDYIIFNYSTGSNNIVYIKKPQIEIGESPTDYIPYQGNTTYIPISSPLFAGDQLIKRNMEYKILRKNGFKVYDASEDEVFSLEQAVGYYDYYTMVNDAKESSVATINYFKNIVLYQDGAGFISKFKNLNLVFSEDRNIKTVEEFKNWLKSHIVFVRYVLATPIEEELSPEAQKAIHSIMACDEQTTIEIVGVPTDAEVQNQFLLPRNVDGALNTTAYATSKRNEITLEEQQTATEARLQAIEAQILKEV